MAINEWWAGDTAERYWLEITDREDLGEDLYAPKTDRSGNETWSYSLVSHVRDGDVVFHYWKQAEQDKAIVGYSQATGELETTTIRWQPHGTYGRAIRPTTGPVEARPAWRFPLANFTDLASPVPLDKLRDLEPELRRLSDELANRHGEPLYLPFVFSDKRPLRTAQGYLTKLPASFLAAIPGLDQALQVPNARRPGVAGRKAPIGGSGYQSDPKIRKALERHAVQRALRHFSALGFRVEDVGDTNPYDVVASNGDAELHIEVKGSAGMSTTVELTAGEVNEAQTARKAKSVLFVVDQISWTRSSSGDIQTTGGRTRIWSDWSPDQERLTPTSYRYLLPPASDETSQEPHRRR